jgi:hypothetical protein
MNRSTPLAVVLSLIVALVLTVKIEEHRLNTERNRTAVAALAVSNAAAERDSTRTLALALLGDSLEVVERQVIQVAQRGDDLDAALKRERKSRYQMSVVVDSRHGTSLATTVHDTVHDMRRASFQLRQPPYTVAAHVEMKEHPDSARLSLTVALDPIHMDARLTCAAPNERGIRAATVVAAAPSWANVRLDRVEQSPDLCASPALMSASRSKHRLPQLLIGVGRVMNVRGLASWGLFVGIGTTLWG